MRRFFGTNIIKAAVLAGTLLMTLAAAIVQPHAAHADATTYSSTKRQFKVGILVLDSSDDGDGRGPENPDPYIFYIGDTRTDVKPQNWELINPLAPSQVTAAIKARWDARDGTPGDALTVGQNVAKNMAAYWEVSLSQSSLKDLLQFDLLFITNHRTWSLTPTDREKLRKLVDAGGIVWLEDCGGMRINKDGPFFLNQLQFSGGNFGNANSAVLYQPNHPILNTPYKLTYQEISNLGDKNYGNYCMVTMDTNGNVTNTAPNPETLINIVGNGNCPDVNSGGRFLPYIAAGNYGSGAVIATSGDSGCDINDYAGGASTPSGGNSGAICGPNLSTAHTEDLKFLYNLISWGSANNTFRRNPRRTADSFQNVGAPLVSDFDVTLATTSAITGNTGFLGSNAAPLTVGGLLYQTGRLNGTGNGQLRAYDADPQSEYYGLGTSDDGILDLSRGAPYDEVWESSAIGGNGVAPSAPVYATLNNGTVQAILVTASDGTLYAFPAVAPSTGPFTNIGPLVTNPPKVFSSPTTYQGGIAALGYPDNMAAPAPVYIENKVFVAQPDGSVRCVNPVTNQTLYVTFITPFQDDSTQTTQNVTPTGTPTLGYVAQSVDNSTLKFSGGSTNDLMLYEPIQATSGGGDVLAYWLGTRNEVLKRSGAAQTGAVSVPFRTRVALNLEGGQQKYRVARGDGSGGAAADTAFLLPRVHVYAPVLDGTGNITTSAEDNYKAGTVSPDYVVQTTNGPTGLNVDGTITVVATSGTIIPTVVQADLIVAVDYDVYYNDPDAGANGNPPGLNQKSNARKTGSLFKVATAAFGYSTLAMTPDDLLIGSFAEQTTSGNSTPGNASGAPFGSPEFIGAIVATNEVDGAASGSGAGNSLARQKIRMTLHPGYTATVGNLTVSDAPVIRNRIIFGSGWPTGTTTSAYSSPGVLNPAEAIGNLQPYGAPIAGNNGISYVLAKGTSLNAPNGLGNGNVTVLIAFKASGGVTLTLPEAFNGSQNVTIQQVNAMDDTAYAGNTNAPSTVSVSYTGNNSRWSTDPDNGRITILDFHDSGASTSSTPTSLTSEGKTFSATQSFIVTYTPRGATATKTVVLPPTSAVVSDPTQNLNELTNATQRAASSGFSPVLWYYVIPGTPDSSPTLSGSVLYFNQERLTNVNGQVGVRYFVVAVDADPAATDPLVRIGSGEQILGVYNDATNNSIINHVRWATVQLPGPGYAPPVASEDTLAVSNQGGLDVYRNSTTLIADSRRIIEVDGGSAAVWAVDAPVNKGVVGGALPVYNGDGTIANSPTATGRTVLQRLPFAHPSVARQIIGNDYLVADTGNNRVLRMDRTGQITWSLTQVNNPFGILAAGDPVTLKEPSDIQFYRTLSIDPVSKNTLGYEVHYLIADTGNFRILDVADYYDTNGKLRTVVDTTGASVSGEHVVVYSTRTGSAQARSLRYQSIQRIFPIGAQTPTLIAVVGNVSVTAQNTVETKDFSGGSLVQLKYEPYLVPGSAWTTLGTEPPGNGTVEFAFNSFDIQNNGNVQTQRITMPTFFEEVSFLDTTVNPAVYKYYYLLCDASGVYTLTLNNNRLQAIWRFNQQDYVDLFAQRFVNFPAAGVPKFVPSSVQRLANGAFLITNSYSGDDASFTNGRFVGEVFQVMPNAFAGTDTAHGGTYDGFSAPNILGPDSLNHYKQIMGTSSSNTSLMEQPRSASRQ